MRSVTLRIAVVICCVLGTSAYLVAMARPEVVPSREPLATVPMTLDGWTGRRQPDFTPQILGILGVDDYITRAYVRDGVALDLYVGYYGSQRQGDAIHSPLNCLPGSGGEPLTRSTIRVDGSSGAGPPPMVINRYVVQKGLDRQLVLYWYQSHGRVVASEYVGRFWLLRDAVRLNRTDAALVRVASPIPTDATGGEGTEKQTVRFIADMFSELAKYLPS